jgi:hypothetical protein
MGQLMKASHDLRCRKNAREGFRECRARVERWIIIFENLWERISLSYLI